MSVPALPRDAPSLEALRAAVDEIDAQVVLLGPDGRLVHENPARIRVLATDPLRADAPPDRYPLRTAEAGPRRTRRIAAGIRQVLAGERQGYEDEYVRDGRSYALRATPMAVDGVGALVVVTDVTADRPVVRASRPAGAAATASRRLVAERLDELLATGPVGVVALRVRRTGPRSLDRLAGDPAEALRGTAALLEQLVPGAAVTGRTSADHFVVLLPGVDDAALRRAVIPLAAGWRARIGRPHDLEATVETLLAEPGEDGEDVLARLVGGITPSADAGPDRPTALAGG